MSAGGKGHSPRPFDVAFEQYAANFDLIFGKSKNVLQHETENTTATPGKAAASEARHDNGRDRQSPAIHHPNPPTE